MKRMNEMEAIEVMEKELWEVLNTTDYSTYELVSLYCEDTNRIIVPKPLMAIAVVDEDIREELTNEILKHPNCTIMVI